MSLLKVLGKRKKLLSRLVVLFTGLLMIGGFWSSAYQGRLDHQDIWQGRVIPIAASIFGVVLVLFSLFWSGELKGRRDGWPLDEGQG